MHKTAALLTSLMRGSADIAPVVEVLGPLGAGYAASQSDLGPAGSVLATLGSGMALGGLGRAMRYNRIPSRWRQDPDIRAHRLRDATTAAHPGAVLGLVGLGVGSAKNVINRLHDMDRNITTAALGTGAAAVGAVGAAGLLWYLLRRRKRAQTG